MPSRCLKNSEVSGNFNQSLAVLQVTLAADDITYTEAGTQTDHPDASPIDRGTQTDQYNMETTRNEEGRPAPVLIETHGTANLSEQHGETAGNQPRVNATDIRFPNIPGPIPTLSGHPHDPIANEKHCDHPQQVLVHGLFTIHGDPVGIAYSLTFFKSTNAFLSEPIDIRSSSPARSDAVERLPTVPGLAVKGNNGDKDLPMLDPSLTADEGARLTLIDESFTQERYVSKSLSQGRKRGPLSPAEDELLERLKAENLPWKQTYWYNKMKRAREASIESPDDEAASQRRQGGRGRKRAWTARIHSQDNEEASQQLQCELDELAY